MIKAMFATKESATPEEQEDDSTLMPPPMSLNGLNVTFEPRSAPVHLHLTMILRKLFDRPKAIPPFVNERLTAQSLVGPLQTIYRGVCMLQDKLHVAQTNVDWLREVHFHIFAYVHNQIPKVQEA